MFNNILIKINYITFGITWLDEHMYVYCEHIYSNAATPVGLLCGEKY